MYLIHLEIWVIFKIIFLIDNHFENLVLIFIPAFFWGGGHAVFFSLLNQTVTLPFSLKELRRKHMQAIFDFPHGFKKK